MPPGGHETGRQVGGSTTGKTQRDMPECRARFCLTVHGHDCLSTDDWGLLQQWVSCTHFTPIVIGEYNKGDVHNGDDGTALEMMLP